MRSNMLTKLVAVLFSLLLSMAACRAQDAKPLPLSIQYVTKSVEYAALCEQVYGLAWPVVKQKALAQTENWVVVLDVDETVLDNAQYAVERAQIDSGFTRQSWSAWVRRETARLIPGVKAFLDSLRTLGPLAHVAFLTNRRFENEEPTVANLRKVDVWHDDDIILTRKSRDDTKADRRRCLEEGTGRCEAKGPLSLIALFGDNIRDFMPMQGIENARNYRQNELPRDARWGTKFFMLPNPTYGSWEQDYQ